MSDSAREIITSRRRWVESLREKYPFSWPSLPPDHPTEVGTDKLFDILAKSARDFNLVFDAGGPRLYSGLYWWPVGAQSYFSSYSSGAMGWSLGGAIGVHLANSTRPTIVFIGDGSMWMSGNELADLARDRIPILIVVLNNSGYGTVQRRYQDQKAMHIVRTPEIDWCLYASSMNCQARKIESCDYFRESVEAHIKALSGGENPGPLLLEVNTPSGNTFPSRALIANGYQETPSENGY